MRLVAALAAFALLVAPALSRAEEPAPAPAPVPPSAPPAPPAVSDPVSDADLEAALLEAGKNRPELDRVLAHFQAKRSVSPHGIYAARFLIANMPGKGYIVTALKDAQGNVIPYDPLAFADFEKAQVAYEALEKVHGPLEFKRDHVVLDLETLTAAYLIRHVETALDVWQTTPADRRVSFPTFLEYVLPYRGSEEPAEDWLTPTRARLTEALKETGAPGADATPAKLWRWINKWVEKKVHFNERYYLHPTDQGFAEMDQTCAGRCEDITNMTTYCARALGLATAADYTPAWGHRDNNHAWNVLLDADGRGSDKAQAHAPKVYRKVYSLQKNSLSYVLPKGREPPNRFLMSKSQIDVTGQYGGKSDPGFAVSLPPEMREHTVAYLCVFNGGEWVAVDWGRIVGWAATPEPRGLGAYFGPVGTYQGGMLLLAAVFDGNTLLPTGPPLLKHEHSSQDISPGTGGGTAVVVQSFLSGTGVPTVVTLTAVAPSQKSVDTGVTTPVSQLRDGAAYVFQQWTSEGWKVLKEVVATKEPLRFEDLPSDGLYWLVEKDSRKLERPFTIENGRQRFW